jgi:hypothetical protein
MAERERCDTKKRQSKTQRGEMMCDKMKETTDEKVRKMETIKKETN